MPRGVYKHKVGQGFQKGNTVWLGRSLSEEHKAKLRKPKAKPSHFKGKTYAEIYGDDWREQIAERRRSRIKYHDRVGRNRSFRRPAHEGWIYREFTRKVFERDDFKCQLCGARGGRLHADHYPRSFADIVMEKGIKNMQEAMECKDLWDVGNGRTVCVGCHKKTKTYGRHVDAKKIEKKEEVLSAL